MTVRASASDLVCNRPPRWGRLGQGLDGLDVSVFPLFLFYDQILVQRAYFLMLTIH